MGYKDPEKQNNFQKQWLHKRRADWVAANAPCKSCGSAENLRLVRIDTSKKRINWGWSEGYRNETLKNYKVLCRLCAVKHYSEVFKKKYTGRKGAAEKLTPAIVWAIRGRLMGKESIRAIAGHYHLNHKTVIHIQKGEIWAWLKFGKREVFGFKKSKELT